MIKNQYISLILLVVLLVTIVNIYYKPKISLESFSTVRDALPWSIDPIKKSVCPLYGFQCPTDEPCDCLKLCVNGQDFVPFRVVGGDHIYVMNRKLTPGTYCLPKGVQDCSQKTSRAVFSLSGWMCSSRNDAVHRDGKTVACQNSNAADNDSNVLWDFKLDKPAENVSDYYEKLDDGKTLRYRCKCGSKDVYGKPLVSVLPFVCSVDYCVRDIADPLPMTRWNGSVCECGPYLHLDPNDLTSPCMMETNRFDQQKFIGRVDCMTSMAWIKHPMYCPEDEAVLSFTTSMAFEANPLDYLRELE